MVALGLLVLSVLGHLSEADTSLPLIGSLPFHAALATVALLGPGRPILSGVAAARHAPSMDTLVGLGVGSAYGQPGGLDLAQVGWPCFFNEPVMLLGFVLLGRFLEERAVSAQDWLCSSWPNCNRKPPAWCCRMVPSARSALRAVSGDVCSFWLGIACPWMELWLKGSRRWMPQPHWRALPLQAEPGSELSSGSLNLEAPLVIEVTRVGRRPLWQIIRMVEQAQAGRAPIQGLADRVAGRFCYGVMALAVGTFLFWWLFGSPVGRRCCMRHHLACPRDIRCPCHAPRRAGRAATTPIGLALQLAIAVLVGGLSLRSGLATPTVITVATGLAARRGWLFRGGDVIETAAGLDRIVFDKTGTLTLGRPLVTDVFADDAALCLQLAASLEHSSRHPLAHALLQEAQRRNLDLLEPSRVATLSGQGLEGQLDGWGDLIRVGKPDWLEASGVAFSEQAESWLAAARVRRRRFPRLATVGSGSD